MLVISSNITKVSNEKIQNAIREVSKGDCIVMGDFNHGNIQWDTLESTGVEDQQCMCLIQDNFLIQHVLEPTRGGRVLDLVLSSQKDKTYSHIYVLTQVRNHSSVIHVEHNSHIVIL